MFIYFLPTSTIIAVLLNIMCYFLFHFFFFCGQPLVSALSCYLVVPLLCFALYKNFREKNYTLSSYTLSRKKQKMFNNIMFGALGNTWRHKFYMGMQNAMNLEK